VDQPSLHALGVLVPIRFSPVKLLPGRHPLGRAGLGMRLLRTRPFVAGEDNPRDIDKYSAPDDRQVVEWEDEAQASITLLVDMSASMQTGLKAPVRNACVLQLLYSLWRAGDRVGVALFNTRVRSEIRGANLRSQMQQTAQALLRTPGGASTDVTAALNAFVRRDRRRHSNLLFVISDFLPSDDAGIEPQSEWRSSINEIRHNIVPVIVSFEIPATTAGLVKLVDPEHGERRMAQLSARRVGRINRAERQRTRVLLRRFRSAGLDCMTVAAQGDVYPELTRLARVRRQRRG
jgi:uncharacterized protein (DUF58 family)